MVSNVSACLVYLFIYLFIWAVIVLRREIRKLSANEVKVRDPGKKLWCAGASCCSGLATLHPPPSFAHRGLVVGAVAHFCLSSLRPHSSFHPFIPPSARRYSGSCAADVRRLAASGGARRARGREEPRRRRGQRSARGRVQADRNRRPLSPAEVARSRPWGAGLK